MALMESVVSSLDDEMMEVGQELSSVVGRRCHSRGLSALTSLISRMDRTAQVLYNPRYYFSIYLLK